MAAFDQKLFRRVHALCVGHLESTLSDAEHAELEGLLRESADARRIYIAYFQETACLRWHCLEEWADSSGAPAIVETTDSGIWHWFGVRPMSLLLGLLACLLVAVGLATWLRPADEPNKIVQVVPAMKAPDFVQPEAPRAEAVATV